MQNGGEGFGLPMSAALFQSAQGRLLEILVVPRSSEYGLTMDRLEAYGNTLAVLIALDATQFQLNCQASISAQPPAIQSALGVCFAKFLDSSAHDFSNITKSNRILFVRRFRAFVMELRSIVLFA